jgi:hypothetical protein
MGSISRATGGIPESMTLEATVIRADGSREVLGTIAYWHRNPFKRLLWRMKQHLQLVRGM